MIAYINGVLVDSFGRRIKTNSELFREAVEKDNQRVTKEWEELDTISGNDPAATRLAAMQGNRFCKLAAKYGYVLMPHNMNHNTDIQGDIA